ncbi:MAG: hypothetical protein GY755_23350 [Chloroflexi bacterium]|nr:hypothetical protein [Chloroflexota bacterium]
MSNIDSLIYSPSDGVSYSVKYLEKARANIKAGLGLRFPIAKIAEEYPMPPLMPGKIFTVQGKSHNAKSMFIDFWKNDLAEKLHENHRKEDIIISVLAEDMVEEALAGELLRQAERQGVRGKLTSMDTVRMVAGEIASTPIYYIGQSIARANENMIKPTMSNVARAIARIIELRKDKGLNTHVQGVFVDYIQAMPMDSEVVGGMPDKVRRLQVRADFFGLRQLAAQIPAPCVLASQSKQKLDGGQAETMQTPYLYDHQETSAIPQHTDADMGIWLPKTSLEYGTTITHKGKRDILYPVIDNLAWISINKQRGFNPETLQKLPAGMKYPLNIDFERGTFSLANLEEMVL